MLWFIILAFPGYRHLYSRLSLSWSPWHSLKYFEISVPRYIKFAELRKKINRTTTFHKWICNLTPEVKRSRISKILWKRGEIAPCCSIFCYQLLDFHVKTGIRLSLRNKRFFEISEVEITRVDCISVSL